ncbi:MAG: hypothetical protein Q8O84_01420 [Nanoarchaeota archaeon]|nr:hypothetical protein [Nanoarchaeota archaeon]
MKKSLLTLLTAVALLTGKIKDSYSQNKILIYGDSNHQSEKQENFMINSIDSLKKQGYNYFATELPKKYDKSIQKYFYTNKEEKDSIINLFLKWRPSNIELNMCYEFYKKGFKVVPIDTIYEELEGYSLNEEGEIVAEMNNRDPYMAKNIEKILEENPFAKMIVYVGALHAAENSIIDSFYKKARIILKNSTMAEILKKGGHNIETIYLEGEIYPLMETVLESNDFFDKIIYLE